MECYRQNDTDEEAKGSSHDRGNDFEGWYKDSQQDDSASDPDPEDSPQGFGEERRLVEAVRFDCSGSWVDAEEDFERRYDWGTANDLSAEKRNGKKQREGLQTFVPSGPLTSMGI